MIITIKELYPDAFKALSHLYSTSESNRWFYEFKIVHRFIRCNFGEYDALQNDVDAMGGFHMEQVKCPLRGECIHEGCICMPALQTTLSPREREVALLLGKGYDKLEVANEMQISVYTVNRHVQNIKARLRLKHTHQIVSLFKNQD